MTAESAVETAVAFARTLRTAGVDVPLDSVTAYVEALGAVGLRRRQSIYWAGRATLVRSAAEIPVYDEAFASFWLGREATRGPVSEERTLAFDVDAGHRAGDVDALGPARPAVTVRYSAHEVLRHRDFAAYSPEEFAEARTLIADLRVTAALRRSRRRRVTPRGRRPDVRGTVRAALRAGGEPIRRSSFAPAQRPRRVVLLCDVSGSMEPYTRALLRFLHAAVVGRGSVEAFVFATRLTRITRPLSWRDPDAALARAGVAVADWAGGTRLGAVLHDFNTDWGDLARGAVVVVLSDGWDRGDPAALTAELVRLRRHAHRVVWVNPLKATPGYAPLARGMAAALPYVDDFVEGHSLAAIEELVEVIAKP